MSEPNESGEGAPVGDVEPTNAPDGVPGEGEPKVFDEAYVKTLRDEAATSRVRALRADDLAEGWYRAAVELATANVLHDPADLPRSDDHFDPDTGRPDVEKIRADAEALADAKPHLSRPRKGVFDVQGVLGQREAEQVGLGTLLRNAAR